MRVLVLDDDRYMGEFLAKELAEHGHEAIYESSATKAIQRTASEHFDLLITDLVMPELNGLQTIRAVRQRSNLPVLVLSSLEPSQWEERCLDAGAFRYLQKPTDIKELLAEVGTVNDSLVVLNIGLIDFDVEHRDRLHSELSRIGCQVEAWASMPELVKSYPTGAGELTLLVIDSDLRDVVTALGWSKRYRVPAVVFGPPATLDEDQMLRLGASLCVNKPVDGKYLLTQARFLVG